VFSTFVRCARLTLVALVFVTSLLVILAAGVAWLYGGEADEAIRFMEPEPMPEPVPEPVPEASMSMPDRDRELEVLRAVVGVSGANYFGTEGHKSKQFGVNLYVRPEPEAERQQIRVPCAADKPTQADAARVAKRRVAAILGEAAVETAERLVTERHTAGPSVERNVNAVLGETQRLRAVLRGAETRADAAERAATRAEAEAAEAVAAILRAPEEARKAAWLEVEAAQASLDAHTKRQRVEQEAIAVKEPEWRSRPYAAYDTVQKWIDREGELWKRRRVKYCIVCTCPVHEMRRRTCKNG
jgi:hypothetical protein